MPLYEVFTMKNLCKFGPDQRIGAGWRIHVPPIHHIFIDLQLRFKIHEPFSYFVSLQSPCSSSPCQHEATCVTNYRDGSFGCRCAEGFIGEYCEKGEYFGMVL